MLALAAVANCCVAIEYAPSGSGVLCAPVAVDIPCKLTIAVGCVKGDAQVGGSSKMDEYTNGGGMHFGGGEGEATCTHADGIGAVDARGRHAVDKCAHHLRVWSDKFGIDVSALVDGTLVESGKLGVGRRGVLGIGLKRAIEILGGDSFDVGAGRQSGGGPPTWVAWATAIL